MSPHSITRPSVRRLAILAAAIPALAGAGAMVQPAIASACTCPQGQHESSTKPGTCVPDTPTPTPGTDADARTGAHAGSGAHAGTGPRTGSGSRARRRTGARPCTCTGTGTGSRAGSAAGRAGRRREEAGREARPQAPHEAELGRRRRGPRVGADRHGEGPAGRGEHGREPALHGHGHRPRRAARRRLARGWRRAAPPHASGRLSRTRSTGAPAFVRARRAVRPRRP